MSEWIKHDKEKPKEHAPIKFKVTEGHINAGIGLGVYSSVLGYCDGERELVFMPDEIEGWKPWVEQDPHKEWVKIEPGCPMPEDGENVVFVQHRTQYSGKYVFGGFAGNETGETYEPEHWRYPHPDPVD